MLITLSRDSKFRYLKMDEEALFFIENYVNISNSKFGIYATTDTQIITKKVWCKIELFCKTFDVTIIRR